MKRLLLTILLASTIWSTAQATSSSTEYLVSDSGQNVAATNNDDAIGRRGYRAAITTDGDVYVLFGNNSTSRGMWMAYTLDWGTGWTLDKNVFGVSGGDIPTTLYQYYDSVFAIKATSTNEAYEVRRWVNGTQTSVVDPAASNTTAGSRPGIVKVGNKLLVTTDIEDSDGDSSEVKITDATWDASTTSWTHISQHTPIIGGGLRVPMDSATNMKGAVMMLDMNAEDVYMADSSGISSAIEAALTSTDRQTPGFHRFWALPWGVRDSFLVMWQADATTNTALLARPGHLVYGGSGSATSIAWDTTAEITVLADGVLADNWFGAPTAVWFPGTDSGMFMFRQNNGANVDLVGKLISRDGKTFGADTVLHAGSTASQNKWGIQSSIKAYISGTNKRFPVAYQDSLATGICNVRVLLVNYDTGTPAGSTPTGRSTIKDNSIKTSTMFFPQGYFGRKDE